MSSLAINTGKPSKADRLLCLLHSMPAVIDPQAVSPWIYPLLPRTARSPLQGELADFAAAWLLPL